MKEEIQKTPVTVRVQALGGKFLAADSAGTEVTITNHITGEVLASGYTNSSTGNSGKTITPLTKETYDWGASNSVIITPFETWLYFFWVISDDSTVHFSTELSLSEPTLVEIKARVPLPPEQKDQYASVTQWLIPGRSYNNKLAPKGFNFILQVPGLWVRPSYKVNGDKVAVDAKVTMMCGCTIKQSVPNWPWPDFNFTIQAELFSPEFTTEKVLLAYSDVSEFSGLITGVPAGEYELRVYASQIMSSNTAVATMTVSV